MPLFSRVPRRTTTVSRPPHAAERPCYECPVLHLKTRSFIAHTVEGTWVGFRWYRFVDQPELSNVFASLPDAERAAAKCYMQRRIERLHAAAGASAWQESWFEPPQGNANLPAEKVSIDSNLLVTPPSGMEKGYVPIPVYNRLRTKPSDCDVIVAGSQSEETCPLPSNYFGGQQTLNDDREMERCVGNVETANQKFDYPGTIYPFSPAANQSGRLSYAVPLRADVGTRLPTISPTCGLLGSPGGYSSQHQSLRR